MAENVLPQGRRASTFSVSNSRKAMVVARSTKLLQTTVTTSMSRKIESTRTKGNKEAYSRTAVTTSMTTVTSCLRSLSALVLLVRCTTNTVPVNSRSMIVGCPKPLSMRQVRCSTRAWVIILINILNTSVRLSVSSFSI